MNRRRLSVAALATLAALAAGCGSSGDEAAPAPPAAAATVTVVVSDWSAGDCDPAGKSADAPGTYVFGDGERRQVEVDLEPSLEPRDVG